MKYIIFLKSLCSFGLAAFGVLIFIYSFNMVMVVNDTKKISQTIEEVTARISEQTSEYYATQSSVEDSNNISEEYTAPVSRVYIDIKEQDTSLVVTR